MKNNFELSEKELKRFNWGALLLGWIWGIFNRSWITLIQLPLSYIPKVGWVFGGICALIFGIKGNSWAYNNKKFEDLEEFNSYQKKFIYAGIVFLFITFAASWISIQTDFMLKKGSKEMALYIIQLTTTATIGSSCLILVYLTNFKKRVKAIMYGLIILLALAFGTMPALNWLGRRALEQYAYKDAAIIYNTLGNLSANKINKNRYYNLTAGCYIELKDIDNAIKNFEKAENADKNLINPESSMLTDLYIIKGNKNSIIGRDDYYKQLALESKWEEVIEEVTPKIENPKTGIAIEGKIYSSWDYYLARAIAYKNTGRTKEAKKDLNCALKAASPKQAEYINSAYNNYKNYYKDYFNLIKSIFEIK